MSFVVTSSQTQTKHLPLPRVRRLGRDLRETLARDASDRLDAGGKLRRHEDAERVVVLDARARLREQRVRRLPAAGGDEQVAVEALAVEDEPAHATLAALRRELARPGVAEVDDLRDLDADLLELLRDRQASRRRAPSTIARSPGLIEKSRMRRRTPSGSITPTRSLPGNTSGCSVAPVATTIRSARKR